MEQVDTILRAVIGNIIIVPGFIYHFLQGATGLIPLITSESVSALSIRLWAPKAAITVDEPDRSTIFSALTVRKTNIFSL